MKVVVFGASGATGREIVRRSLAEGHEITAFVRDPARLGDVRAGVAVVAGDVADPESVRDAVAGQDAVLSALGVGRPLRPDPVVVEGVGRIVATMQRAGVQRLVSLSFVGVRQSRPHAGPVIRHALSRIVRHEIADHERKEELIARSDLDWTIVRAPKLTNGRPAGAYRSGEEITARRLLPTLSRADVAEFMVRQLTDTSFVRKAPSLFPG